MIEIIDMVNLLLVVTDSDYILFTRCATLFGAFLGLAFIIFFCICIWKFINKLK